MLVNKAAQQGAGVGLGRVAGCQLEPDSEDRPAKSPDVLAVLLEEVSGLRVWFDGLGE